MTNPGMPNDPGDPDQTDEQNLSPNEAETEAAAAADAQGADEDDDVYTTQPDPNVDGETDPTLAAEVDEALAGVEDELAAEDAESQEPTIEAELAERTEDLQRVSAEYANYRRRTERDREGLILSAKASVLTSLLPVLDDIELAGQHGDLKEGSPLKSFADKLNDTLKGQKLEAFGTEGEAFDPEIHEAVQDLSSGEDKAVGTVLRKGYRVGERLIRTAMVIIADPATGTENAGNADAE